MRGKAKAPVELRVKFDLSLDSEGYGHIEKISFEAYNESGCLIEAVGRFRAGTGHYPERVLADQTYRTRENWYLFRYGERYKCWNMQTLA